MIRSDLSYIIHSRPYRESSLLLKVVTRDHGVISMVQRGARKSRKPIAQPFNLIQISWSGSSELKTLRTIETLECRLLTGKNMYIGLYLNELMMRLMGPEQTITAIFDRYHHLVYRLSSVADDAEPLLRSFEFALLEELGYGFSLERDALRGEKVQAGQSYCFDPQQGILLLREDAVDSCVKQAYRGEHLLSMAALDYSDPQVKVMAKKLMREALAPLLGSKPLMSRELFKGYISDSGVR